MTLLIAAAFVFLAIHLLIAGTKIRDSLTGAIGERAYIGFFSVLSVAVIVWLCVAYNAAQSSGEDRAVYDLGAGLRDLAIPIVAIAFLIGVPGLMMPNPTAVGQTNAVSNAENVRGILRVTRHPFLWGVAIWAAFHTLANGDLASIVFFGTFLVLAVAGTVSIDAKRERKLGQAWQAFAVQTSNIPFAAILSGRNKFRFAEYFDWRFGVALAIFLVMLFAHSRLFGASPFPGN